MIAVTGTTGFIGSALLNALLLKQYPVVTINRRARNKHSAAYYEKVVHKFDEHSQYNFEPYKISCLIHCAGQSQLIDKKESSKQQIIETNTLATVNLAKQAAEAGVKRFIFISSIKVNGELTAAKGPFKANDIPNPKDEYAKSKADAERELLNISSETNMEVVIVRPPMVYGPGVKGNFNLMLKLASLPVPLPFKKMNHNKRALVFIDNLVDLLLCCIKHPNAKNEIFLVSDNNDISTAKMFKILKQAFRKSDVMIAIPIKLLSFMAKLFAKTAILDRLSNNLEIDISDTENQLGWKPIETTENGFCKTVSHFKSNK